MTVLSVCDLPVNGYVLSVTTRNNGDSIEIMQELTFRTVSTWLFIADLLERGIYEIKAAGSIESRFCADKGIVLSDSWSDSRVTVWSTFRGQKNPSFHLNSDDDTQRAIDTWAAQQAAIERITAKYAQNAPPDAPNGSNSSASPTQAIMPQTAPQAPIAGVVVATRAPSPKSPQYADGQLVSYRINKIVAGSNKGSATYALWGELGSKYPLVTVYKFKPNSTDLKPDYLKAQTIIEALGLSLDRPEVAGNWFLVCRAAHSNGVEYMNIHQLETVTA